MQFTTKIMSLLLTISQVALIAGSTLPSLTSRAIPEGHEMVLPTFTGTINGQDYALNGTVQEVVAQLEKIHPDINEILAANPVEKVTRATQNKDGVLCIPVRGQNWNPANVNGIVSGINILYQIGGRLGINSRQCARLSCYANSAIYICNDNYYFINPALPYLATYAQDIANSCRYNGLCGGQEFDSDHYNIIVHTDSCP